MVGKQADRLVAVRTAARHTRYYRLSTKVSTDTNLLIPVSLLRAYGL